MINKIIEWFFKQRNDEIYLNRIKNLKKRGLKVGKNVIISPGIKIDENYPYLISIGNNCVIGVGVRLIAHDLTMNMFNGNYTKLGQIKIKDNCIIGINSIILPGVTIGPNVLVAAGSVVNKDIPSNSCVAGNPARFYSNFDDLLKKLKEEIKNSPQFEAVDLVKKEDEKDPERTKRIIESTEKGFAFINGVEAKFPVWLKNTSLERKK